MVERSGASAELDTDVRAVGAPILRGAGNSVTAFVVAWSSVIQTGSCASERSGWRMVSATPSHWRQRPVTTTDLAHRGWNP